MNLSSCKATRRLTLPSRPDLDCDGFGRADGGSKRSRIERGEHCRGILVDHGEQGASWCFRRPPPSLPVLDRVKAEPKRVREFGLRHAKPIADGLHVDLLGHMCLESFLLPGKKSLNVVKAIHHLLELAGGPHNRGGPFNRGLCDWVGERW